MNRTQIQLTNEQTRALKDLSVQQNKSMAQLIREAIDTLLRSRHLPAQDDLRRRAIQAAGRFRSGVPDLATRHDDYLAESYGDGDLH
jgi:predicted DNA-binding protein